MPRNQLTQAIHNEVVENLRSGCFYDEAGRAAGLGKATVYAWIRRGEEIAQRMQDGYEPKAGELKYVFFAEDCRKTSAEAIVHAHSRIRRAMQTRDGVGDWKAAMWYLSVRHPARYSAFSRRLESPPTAEQVEGLDSEDTDRGVSETDRRAVVVALNAMREERRRSG